MRVRLPDPALRADLRDFFRRWGCITYKVNDDAIEVVRPRRSWPSARGAASSTSTSRPGEHIARVSSWSSSTDASARLTSMSSRAPASQRLPCARKLGLAWGC